ncbi:hypothetical protein [Halobacillus ihumii]|uniref:hypothetical protein n=1 Tax=Halobacillus ihumii TaxID=2686092 RepID=UPI0013CF9903|nr:hypothetical protein [Halobacillus ihumii]
MSFPTLTFVLIITETKEEADAINRKMPDPYTLGNMKVEAKSVGTIICGLRFKTTRPTVIIEKYTSWNEWVEKWRNEVLVPCADKNATFL